MASFNKVILMGNLTKDPQTRETSSGTSVCNFRIAINRRYRTSNGEDREDTCFVDIEVWGRQAENCSRYLQKGAPVLVEGRLRQDQWQDKETGQNRSRLLVTAFQVQFLSSSGGGTREGEQQVEESAGGGGSSEQTEDSSQAIPSPPNLGEESSEGSGPSEDDIPF